MDRIQYDNADSPEPSVSSANAIDSLDDALEQASALVQMITNDYDYELSSVPRFKSPEGVIKIVADLAEKALERAVHARSLLKGKTLMGGN